MRPVVFIFMEYPEYLDLGGDNVSGSGSQRNITNAPSYMSTCFSNGESAQSKFFFSNDFSINNIKAEFGFPSTHATAASALSFGTLFCLIGRYNFSVSLGYLIATWHTTWVCVSRVYKGMHSILDIMGGLAISFLYITIGWKYLNEVQLYIATNTFSPVVVMLANFCSGWFYPGGNCASRKDTVMILGVGAGVNVATWSNYQLGIFIRWENSGRKYQFWYSK